MMLYAAAVYAAVTLVHTSTAQVSVSAHLCLDVG